MATKAATKKPAAKKAKAAPKTKAAPAPKKTKAEKAEKNKAKKVTAKHKKSATKAEDFRAKSADELGDQLGKLKKEQFNLRFQRANGQLENTGRIRVVRKTIARIETVLHEQRRQAQAQG